MSEKNPSFPATPHHLTLAQGARSPANTAQAARARPSLREELAGPRRKGLSVIFLFCLILFGWGGTAPIAGGAMARGAVTPDEGRQKIQHFEGGIVQKIMIHEGELVHKGQPLVILADIHARTGYNVLVSRIRSLKIRMARLVAERDNKSHMYLPSGLLEKNAAIKALFEAQKRIFKSRQNKFRFQRQVNAERLVQLKKNIEGDQARLDSLRAGYRQIARTLRIKRRLMRKRLVTEDVLRGLEGRLTELRGQIGKQEAEISRTHQRMAEVKVESFVQEAERMNKITLELDKLRGELAAVKQRMAASADVLKRTIIRAPAKGTIVGLIAARKGAVINKGQTLMTIVPSHDHLVVNARILPRDIDIVHKGLKAKISFTAYSMREVPPIEGTVRTISNDRLVSPRGQRPYYLARIEIDRAAMAKNAPNIKLVSGMAANVLIVTKERTMLQYLLDPLLSAMRRSMREA